MQNPPENTKPTIENSSSVERDPDSLAEWLGLPYGFVTEKGSTYQYNDDGSVHREKFDGTSHNQDLAVFIDGNQDNFEALGIMLSTMGRDMPPEEKRTGYIMQMSINEEGRQVGHRIYSPVDVSDASMLAFVIADGNGKVRGGVPARIRPAKGDFVFETTLFPDGTSSRHVGHQVSEIIE